MTRCGLVSSVVSAILIASSLPIAAADRGGNWEGTLQVIGNRAKTINGENGSSLDVDSTVGFGFGFGYNFNSKFALNFDGSFIKPKYEAVFNTEDAGLVSLNHKMSIFNGQVNAVWNIMDGPFTPYLQAGIGWTRIDSNVADGPPTTGCWWDPWWGYTCRSFFSTYNETNFSYGFGAGLRYEFGGQVFVKGSVNRYEIDYGEDGADPRFDMWRLEIGRMF
jgi:opacity protein-like surface antigen